MHQCCIHWFPFMFHVKRPAAEEMDFFCLVAVMLNIWKLYNCYPWKQSFIQAREMPENICCGTERH